MFLPQVHQITILTISSKDFEGTSILKIYVYDCTIKNDFFFFLYHLQNLVTKSFFDIF